MQRVKFLVGADGASAAVRNFIGAHCGVRVERRLVFERFVGETPARSVGAGEGAGGEGEFARPANADGARQILAHAPGRPQSPFDMRVAKLRVFGRENEIAVEREFERAGKAKAVNLCDNGDEASTDRLRRLERLAVEVAADPSSDRGSALKDL